jgi:transcription antitermination factor NusB
MYSSSCKGCGVDRRTEARELAMQAIYQLDVQGEELLSRIDEFFKLGSNDDLVRQLARQWARDAWRNLAACDELILDSSQKWQVARMSQVDRAILRLSVYQLKFCGDIPPKVAINEAIELAKKYSTEAAPSFVNGVLDAVLKKLEVKSV